MNIFRLSDHPDRTDELRQLEHSVWPEFLLHSDVRNWSSLYSTFAQFQSLVFDGDVLVGGGLAVPCPFQPDRPLPDSIDEIVYNAHWPLENPGSLCALAAILRPEFRGQGLSYRIIRAMIDIATEHQLAGVIAPVRPTRKHEHPFEPIDQYASRRDDEDCLWDPWLRVHEQLGGRSVGICKRALTVTGTMEEWTAWTGHPFTDKPEQAVPLGLVPVTVDSESKQVTYVEPNVWYFHPAR